MESVKSTVEKIPLLTVNAGPRFQIFLRNESNHSAKRCQLA